MAESRGSNRKVLVLAGDGIGPEIMRQALRVIEFFDRRYIASFEVTEGLVGGAACDASRLRALLEKIRSVPRLG